MPCPACGDDKSLSSRQLGVSSLAVLECRSCAGLWLDWQTFRMLEERARAGAETGAPPSAIGTQPVTLPPSGARLYRPCPYCQQLMHRRNYGRSSGVLIDTCGSHGVWFDHEELARILRWIGTGGLSRETQRRQEEAAQAERQRRVATGPMEIERGWLETGDPFGKLDLVGELLRWLGTFLR